MQSQNFKPRDPKTPLDIDIDNIAYNETYEEDLEYFGLEEIIDPLNDLSEEYEYCARVIKLKELVPTIKFTNKKLKKSIVDAISEL